MDHHQIARSLAATRLAAGLALVVAPRLSGRLWVGPAGAGAPAAVRGVGVRDVVLGWGTLRALEQGRGAAPWVLGSAACDAGDVAATVLARVRGGRQPGAHPFLASLSALLSAAAGLTAARHIAQE